MNYLFDIHYDYGICTLTDGDTGVGLKWDTGAFETTKKVFVDPSSLMQGDDITPIVEQLTEYAREHYDEV